MIESSMTRMVSLRLWVRIMSYLILVYLLLYCIQFRESHLHCEISNLHSTLYCLVLFPTCIRTCVKSFACSLKIRNMVKLNRRELKRPQKSCICLRSRVSYLQTYISFFCFFVDWTIEWRFFWKPNLFSSSP